MQLILESETTADISVKMSTIEETLDTNFKDSFESLKSDIYNGNKENIECQKNIVDNVDDDHEETIDDQSDLPSTAQNTNLGLEINNDEQLELTSTANSIKLDLETTKNGAGEEVSSNGDSYENCNGISNTDRMNGDGQKCVENVGNEEKEGKSKNIVVNETINQEIEEITLSNKKDLSENFEEKDKDTKKINKSNSNVETKELNILDTKCKEDSADMPVEICMDAIEVDEDISEMIHEVDKTISEMNMVIDEDILYDADEADKETSDTNAMQSEVQIDSECDIAKAADTTLDLDLEKTDEIESETVVPVKSDHNVESEKRETELIVEDQKPDGNQIESLGVKEIDTKTVCEKYKDVEPTSICLGENETEIEDTPQKSDQNEPETVTLDSALATAQSDAELKAVDEPDVGKIEDDVIQIESEQDSEIVENSIEKIDSIGDVLENVVQDDVQKVADADKSMIKEDSSKSVQESSRLEPGKTGSVSGIVVEDEVEVLDVDEIKEVHDVKEKTEDSLTKADEPTKEPVLKLSNTLDILSDDDDEPPQTESQKAPATMPTDKQCINIEDDDDIMLIDEDTDLDKKDKIAPVQPMETEERKDENTAECTIDLENGKSVATKKVVETIPEAEKDPVVTPPEIKSPTKELEMPEKNKETKKDVKEPLKPLLPENFFKSCKKNLADMTREELEEFCILKIVESIVDRSNLGDIKSKLKSLTQNIEEHKKKAMMLTKQNRDLQLVLKSVQEEQKKKPDSVITPLKITRSVGMQVLMTEKIGARKKPNNNAAPPAPTITTIRNIRPINQSPRAQKPGGNQQIPVPRLVPAAANPVPKSPITQNSVNIQPKPHNQYNGSRMSPPVQKAEKRPHNRLQSVTVDLTDDEPPAKVPPRSSPAPPVRLVSSQNLISTPRSQVTAVNSPRKVYIPISGPQGQNIRPGQTIMLKSVPPPGPRQRAVVPNVTRGPAPNVIKRITTSRHPAPLPDSMKQYQPPNWKALPPAPDLKLSKVENGIVISWKIEGYQEDSYEEIASYQLYAYQETSSPPSTALWKKIGDVKALPLPMACTLTQFMAGFKYYFAVRAVDVRSRLGPFSLPGSILLLNKM